MFLTADDIMKLLEVSKATAYRIINTLNRDLQNKGYYTIQGKVTRAFFYDSYYISREDEAYVSLQGQKN